MNMGSSSCSYSYSYYFKLLSSPSHQYNWWTNSPWKNAGDYYLEPTQQKQDIQKSASDISHILGVGVNGAQRTEMETFILTLAQPLPSVVKGADFLDRYSFCNYLIVTSVLSLSKKGRRFTSLSKMEF